MNPDDVVHVVDHAAQMNDRWMFIAVLVILILGGIAIIRLLFTQLENQRQAHAALTEKMAVALSDCGKIMEKLQEYLTRNGVKLLAFGLLIFFLSAAGRIDRS